MRTILLLTLLISSLHFTNAQVSTNFNSHDVITTRGKFKKDFTAKAPHLIPAKDINMLLQKEALEYNTGEAKPFKIAEAVTVDIDVVKEAVWTEDGSYALGKFTIIASGAKSISANLDQFSLPKGTELYVYSENGEMITGPVTENENNENNFLGSWVYKGEMLTIEFKTPVKSRKELILHISSVAYGYKDIYVTSFGFSSPCNVNVLCAAGNGWENERNSVALILDGSSSALCSGALVNNTSNLNIPYLLTANHCFDGNTANWKFTFQAWSASCAPSQNAAGTTFNGSTLRARNAASDFCLVELNSSPPVNSCITAAGWSRANIAPSSGVSITHPRGDVMKIASYNTTITQQTFLGSSDWKVVWSSGTVEPGSSGGPLFNSAKRIIGQVHGGNTSDICTTNEKAFFGRLDVSWTGGGSNSTRLSNWLDPGNTGSITTDARLPVLFITGPSLICSSGGQFQATGVVTWSSSNSSGLTIDPSTGFATRINNFNGTVTVTATSCSVTASKTVWVGYPYDFSVSGPTLVSPGSYNNYSISLWNGQPSFAFQGVGSSGFAWSFGYPPTSLHWDCFSCSGQSDLIVAGSQSTYVTGQVTNSCGTTIRNYEVFVECPTGDCEEPFFVYPNPASDELTVSFNSKDSNTSSDITLIDSNGTIVYSTRNEGHEQIKIPLRGFRNGTYVMSVTRNGTTKQREILIIH